MKKYDEKKMISAFRKYLEETNSRCNPRFELYNTHDLLKVCFLYRINGYDFLI